MANRVKTDVLAQPVGFEARLTERGVKLGVRSRLVAAWDRLRGSKADLAAADLEGQAEVNRARYAAQAELIAEASKAIAKQIKADPALATAVLIGDFQESLKRNENREKILNYTSEEIISISSEGTDPQLNSPDDAETIDPDWMNKFYEYSGSIESDDLQRAFARILAGEIISPNTFAKRTLRSLSELDRESAEQFQKLSRYRNKSNRHIVQPKGEDEFPYATFVALDDAGLISNTPGVGYDLKPDEHDTCLITNGSSALYLTYKEKRGKFRPEARIPVVSLTRFGRDICSILPPEPDELYIDAVAEHLKDDKLTLKLIKAHVESVDAANLRVKTRDHIVIFSSDPPQD